MGDYQIIGRFGADGKTFDSFYIDTNVGRYVMIFSDESQLSEAMAYARRGSSREPDILQIDNVSRAELDALLKEVIPASEFRVYNFIAEGEGIFDDLLIFIRRENASHG